MCSNVSLFTMTKECAEEAPQTYNLNPTILRKFRAGFGTSSDLKRNMSVFKRETIVLSKSDQPADSAV